MKVFKQKRYVMKTLLRILFSIGILISNTAYSQLPVFIQRLDKGSVRSDSFSEKVNFQLKENRIFIDAAIKNRKYKLLMDTYSPCLFYDHILQEIELDTLDKTNQLGKAFEKTFLLPIYPKFDTIKIGQLSFLDIGAMLMKSDSSNPLLRYDNDGILGANLMKSCIWQLNFKDTLLTITNDKKKLSNIEDANALPFSAKPIQGSPNTIIIVNEDTIKVEFDTGNDGFINAISPAILEKIENGEAVPWSIKLGIPINRKDLDSIETHYFVLVDSLKIGTKSYYNLPVIAYNPALIKETSKGSIGIDFLKNFVTTIDWMDNKIYLKENADFKLANNKLTFGFTCEMKDGRLLIKSVFNQSAAFKQGVRIDDRVIAINDIAIDSIQSGKVENLINGIANPKQNDESLKITLSRSDHVMQFELTSYSIF